MNNHNEIRDEIGISITSFEDAIPFLSERSRNQEIKIHRPLKILLYCQQILNYELNVNRKPWREDYVFVWSTAMSIGASIIEMNADYRQIQKLYVDILEKSTSLDDIERVDESVFVPFKFSSNYQKTGRLHIYVKCETIEHIRVSPRFVRKVSIRQ